MRNLLSTRNISYPIISSEAPDLPIGATAWDTNSNSIICAFGPSVDFPVIEISRIDSQSTKTITSWDYHGPYPKDDLDTDCILDLHYFADDLSICLVLKGGDVIIVREEPSDNQSRVEIVGSVEEGITAASWSPDEGLLAISTAAETFVLMTRQFEPVADSKLSADDLKLSKHVNVGWGKKETQFKGKRAAALRDPTMPEKIDEGLLGSCDTGDIKLSWRGDGQCVALSSIQTRERRVIRVFGRNGELDGVSEPVDGMEGALSWRPSGNLIASIKRTPDNLEVIFFERNGLLHGGFPLRNIKSGQENDRVYDVTWNIDSTVLAICFQDRVQFWTTMNYHWYLKYEIHSEKLRAPQFPNTPPRAHWHPEKPLQLHVTANGYLTEMEFSWVVHRGATSTPKDFGIVGVIDGSHLKLTPFRYANIPPPMSLNSITLAENIIDVSVNSIGDTIVALSAKQIDMITWNIPSLGRKATAKVHSAVIQLDETLNYRQVCFFGPNRIALLHGTSSVEIYTRSQNIWGPLGKITNGLLSEGVSFIKLSDHDSNLLCGNLLGDILVFDENLHVIGQQKFPKVCTTDDKYFATEDKRIFLGLSETGHFFANGRLVLNGVTSFATTNRHIIITTTQNFLKFLPIASDTEEFYVPPDDAAGNELCRSIERGAKIVTVIPSTFAVILQMPRGNLETIYPRALVLAGVRGSIDSKDYKTAFSLCRTHRVDLNLLHDHNPSQFIGSVDIFLEQLGNTQYVDLFLSQLKDEDVSRSMYDLNISGLARVSSTETPNLPAETIGKVNGICDAILEAVKKRPLPNTQNMVTCYVSKKPADLDNGLSMISDLKKRNSDDTDMAIEHICFLADVNKLYEHALGIYNLELALLIAQQSQKDPREYLPFLQSIQEMEYLRQRHFIDDFLGRYTKAAGWLNEIGEQAFAELTEYTVKHDLYHHVINLVKYDVEKRMIIVKLHAEYLLGISNYKEAGLSFEYLGSWERALDAYQKCGMWQEALYAGGRIPLSDEEIVELSGVLAESLAENKDFRNSARIHLDYRNDVKEAVSNYCKGSFFEEGMRVIALKGQFSLLEEVVDPALIDSFNTTSELVTDYLGQIKSQTARILDLRVKKESDPVSFYGATVETDAPDNVSIAGTEVSTSAGSIFTRYTDKSGGTLGTSATRRTSKNKRREERKKARGKKGSVYEEEYLINSIGRLIGRLNETQEESYRLMEGLIRRGMRERAESIQAGLKQVLVALEQSKKDVFSPGLVGANICIMVNGRGSGNHVAETAEIVNKRSDTLVQSLFVGAVTGTSFQTTTTCIFATGDPAEHWYFN
ncbi:hypothetical protein H072_9211 [Dactylellina haptotyla CBS 200.50]|uniref:Elongator complex protein 1 n=1 Tax=Dactylellina haptotyla (strain CBS 200.50) TaxID=1284197 RepID=S8BPI5_DACHA|nr:hypothetical protein H072_9211 [Dactylellina haptotyla CBS 200.50]